jgi:uncharacterized membrane protein
VLLSCMLVALIWGVTNCFLKLYSKGISTQSRDNDFMFLLRRWKYLLSLAVNLCGSVLFYILLKDNDISYVVPVVNSMTFGFTTLSGYLFFDEKISYRVWIGLSLVCVGIVIMTN